MIVRQIVIAGLFCLAGALSADPVATSNFDLNHATLTILDAGCEKSQVLDHRKIPSLNFIAKMQRLTISDFFELANFILVR